MNTVRAKKSYGQHFLKNEIIAKQIVDALLPESTDMTIVEVGPGMGVLTKYLIAHYKNVLAVELDRESVQYLKNKFGDSLQILEGDFLTLAPDKIYSVSNALIGNFPYNISSQIVFRAIENREKVAVMVGMFQKEVARRLCSEPGTKEYGILSVYLQTFYDCKYLFTVEPGAFHPPPKIKSGVIKAVRKKDFDLPCDEKLFLKIIKMSFNQRRKTLKNALRPLLNECGITTFEFEKMRAEQLHFTDFIRLSLLFESKQL